ncbi:MAG TPA: hypothetical protein ENK19_01385 [Acidobacteria bacterium]|nr:hypothetical protein [Acidobacteriota bacterium]
MWTLLVLLRRRRPADAWTASAAATAALMMHPMVAYVLLVPMASTWLFLALSGRPVSGSVGGSGEPRLGWRALRTPLSVRGLLPAAVLPILVVWWWYRYFGRFLVHYFHTLRSSWVAAFRGTSRIVASAANVPADWRWLARTSPHHMGSILALLTLLSAVALLARGGTRGRFVTLWLAAAYAGTGVVIDSLSWQYAAFALPLAAAVLAGGVSVCPLRIRSVLAGLIVASSLVGFSILTWGVPSFSPAVARLLGIQREHCYLALCPDAPVSAHFPLDTALATVISQRPSGEESIFLATPVTLTATARYLLLRFHPKRRLRVVGTATPLFGNSLPFRSLLTSRWLLTLPPPSDHNPYLTAVFGMLRAPPPEVASSRRRVASFPWPGGRRLVLYERTRPPTLAEVDATLHALALPPRFVTGAALLAAGLLEREGRTDEAIDRLLAAARIEIQPPRLRAAILARAAALLLKSGRPHEAEARARQALAIVSWNATARRVIREVQRRRTAP